MSDISDFSDSDLSDKKDVRKNFFNKHRNSSSLGNVKKNIKEKKNAFLEKKIEILQKKKNKKEMKTENKSFADKKSTDKMTDNTTLSEKDNKNEIQNENDINKSQILTSDTSLNAEENNLAKNKETPENSVENKEVQKGNVFQNMKAKPDNKNKLTANRRVADCVISPPEFFLSHIYHDNKVFTKKYGHSIVEYNEKFYIYGGINENNECSDEFLTFTYGTNIFTLLKMNINPGKRAYASMTLATNIKNMPCILIFGGLSSANVLADDCYLYYFDDHAWSLNSFKLDLAPELRYGHAYTYCPDTYTTVIWGGVSKNNQLIKTAYKFQKGEWSELLYAGNGPEPRAFASLVWIDRKTKDDTNVSFLYLFGGDLTNKGTPTDELWVYNFSKESWILIENYSGEAPCPRWKHGASIFDKKMWISGGLFSGWFSNYSIPDLYVYDIPSNCWFQCQLSSKEVNCCYDFGTLNLHTKTKAFFLFGGKNTSNEPTSFVCRFAPLCTTVSIVTMRNDINELSNSLCVVKNETNANANVVNEMQKVINNFSIEIREFKSIFELLTKNIKTLKEDIDEINKQLGQLRTQNISSLELYNNLKKEIIKVNDEITNLNIFKNDMIKKANEAVT